MNDIASIPSSNPAPTGARSVPELLIKTALSRAPAPSATGATSQSRAAASGKLPSTASQPPATSGSASKASSPSVSVELSPQAQKIVAALVARDREVRAHEAAHIAAGGGLAGGASYTYQTGPDGERYAVGGEVSIDTSATGNPDEDIARAATIRRAALAPADPSGQDRSVAASATQMEIDARAALAVQRRESAADAAAPERAAGASESAQAASAAANPPVAAALGYAAPAEPSGTIINIQA